MRMKKPILPHIAEFFVSLYDSIAFTKKHRTALKNFIGLDFFCLTVPLIPKVDFLSRLKYN